MGTIIDGCIGAIRAMVIGAGVATSGVMLIVCGDLVRDGSIFAGLIYGAGSLWLFRYSMCRMWALMTNKQEVSDGHHNRYRSR